jgi:large subunit ribosomal protein L22
MVAEAQARFVGSSPRKVRLVVDLIRGKQVDEALTLLRYTPKAAARIVAKVLSSAKANAQQQPGVKTESLYVSEAWVDGGPMLKRVRAGPMGRAMPVRKRTCHIRVVLDEL